MLTRREALGAALLAPMTLAGCRCRTVYPVLAPPSGAACAARPAAGGPSEALLRPPAPASGPGALRAIDAHAHFFNASDIPIRGFLAECVAHQEPALGWLIAKAAPLAEALTERAPTAADEMTRLAELADACGQCTPGERWAYVRGYMDGQTEAAARHVAEITRNTEFLRRYRLMTGGRGAAGSGKGAGMSSSLSADEVLAITQERASRAAGEAPGAGPRAGDAEDRAAAAEGFLTFLTCMLSLRARNLHEYIRFFHRPDQALGVDVVLGAMVDFDYWLDCPPRSPQEHQFDLYAMLATMHGGVFKPVVSYNPWTDIEEAGASLARVGRARACGFVATKIYPAIGFLPTGNATTQVDTRKRRPDRAQLDDKLDAFFTLCADERIPVLAHGEHRNGRDDAHDAFGGPDGWKARLERHPSKPPVVSIGHFGGVRPDPAWTAAFAKLMRDKPDVPLYADISFWHLLMCPPSSTRECETAREQLKQALATPVGSGTVADRVLFGTDWHVFSQVPGWSTYPDTVRSVLLAITGSHDIVQKIFLTNARTCFGI